MGRYLDSGDGSDISYENANDHIQGSSVGMADGPFYPTSYKYKNEKRSQFVRGSFDLFGRYVAVSYTHLRKQVEKAPRQEFRLSAVWRYAAISAVILAVGCFSYWQGGVNVKDTFADIS